MLTDLPTQTEAPKPTNGRAEKVRGMNASLTNSAGAGVLAERGPGRLHITRRQIAFSLVLALLGVIAAIYTVRSVTSGDQSFPAVVSTSKVYDLNFANTGKLDSMFVKVGQRVKPGEVLARQDISALDAQLKADEGIVKADQAALAQSQAPQLTTAQRVQDSLQVQQAQTALSNANAALLAAEASGKAAVAGAQAAAVAARQLASTDQTRYRQACPNGPVPPAPGLTGTDLQTAEGIYTHCQDLQLQLDKDITAVDQTEAQVPVVSAQAQAAIDQAQGSANSARSALSLAGFQQTAQSAPANAATQSQAQANLTQAKAQLAAVQQEIKDATLVAPGAGTVAEVYGALGEYVGPDGVRQYQNPAALPAYQPPSFQLFPQQPSSSTGGGTSTPNSEPVVEIVGGQQQVMAQVPESHLSALQVGRTANVSFSALNMTVPGTVSEVILNPTQNSTAVTYDVVITLKRTVGGLIPGMSATVRG